MVLGFLGIYYSSWKRSTYLRTPPSTFICAFWCSLTILLSLLISGCVLEPGGGKRVETYERPLFTAGRGSENFLNPRRYFRGVATPYELSWPIPPSRVAWYWNCFRNNETVVDIGIFLLLCLPYRPFIRKSLYKRSAYKFIYEQGKSIYDSGKWFQTVACFIKKKKRYFRGLMDILFCYWGIPSQVLKSWFLYRLKSILLRLLAKSVSVFRQRFKIY